MKKSSIQAKLKKVNAIHATAMRWKLGHPSPYKLSVMSGCVGAVFTTAFVYWTATPAMNAIFPIPLWLAALLVSLAYAIFTHWSTHKARTHEAGIAQQLKSYTPSSAQDFADLQELAKSDSLCPEHVLQWCVLEEQSIRANACSPDGAIAANN